MKNLLLSSICLFMAVNCDSTNSQLKKEKQIIKQAVMDYYHEGHVKADPALYDQILHDEWKLFVLDEENRLKMIDKETYKSTYDPGNVDKSLKWETRFFYVDVSQNLAAVKLEIKNQKFGYIDYFNLMKINGKWWIVHKISHRI